MLHSLPRLTLCLVMTIVGLTAETALADGLPWIATNCRLTQNDYALLQAGKETLREGVERFSLTPSGSPTPTASRLDPSQFSEPLKSLVESINHPVSTGPSRDNRENGILNVWEARTSMIPLIARAAKLSSDDLIEEMFRSPTIRLCEVTITDHGKYSLGDHLTLRADLSEPQRRVYREMFTKKLPLLAIIKLVDVEGYLVARQKGFSLSQAIDFARRKPNMMFTAASAIEDLLIYSHRAIDRSIAESPNMRTETRVGSSKIVWLGQDLKYFVGVSEADYAQRPMSLSQMTDASVRERALFDDEVIDAFAVPFSRDGEGSGSKTVLAREYRIGTTPFETDLAKTLETCFSDFRFDKFPANFNKAYSLLSFLSRECGKRSDQMIFVLPGRETDLSTSDLEKTYFVERKKRVISSPGVSSNALMERELLRISGHTQDVSGTIEGDLFVTSRADFMAAFRNAMGASKNPISEIEAEKRVQMLSARLLELTMASKLGLDQEPSLSAQKKMLDNFSRDGGVAFMMALVAGAQSDQGQIRLTYRIRDSFVEPIGLNLGRSILNGALAAAGGTLSAKEKELMGSILQPNGEFTSAGVCFQQAEMFSRLLQAIASPSLDGNRATVAKRLRETELVVNQGLGAMSNTCRASFSEQMSKMFANYRTALAQRKK